MSEYEKLFQAFDLAIDSDVWPGTTPSQWLRILMYVHLKGWMYTPIVDGKMKAVIVAYRIPEVTDESLVRMPVNQSGTILYVPLAFSVNKEDNIFMVVRESLREYLNKNPDVMELVLEDKNKKIKRYKLQGAEDGKIEEVRVTANANVPS